MMTVTMANELSTTGSTLEEVNHVDLVFEPEEEDALFLQLKSKATMQVDGKRSLLAAFTNKGSLCPMKTPSWVLRLMKMNHGGAPCKS
jgi:hypothetical protein